MKSRRSRTFTSSVPALDRAADDAGRQRLLDHRRKDRDDVESHAHSAATVRRLDVVQIQQPLGRHRSRSACAAGIDRRANRRATSGISISPSSPCTTSRLPVIVPSTSLHDADRRRHRAVSTRQPDQVVPVERVRPAAARADRPAPAAPCPASASAVVHRLDAVDRRSPAAPAETAPSSACSGSTAPPRSMNSSAPG